MDNTQIVAVCSGIYFLGAFSAFCFNPLQDVERLVWWPIYAVRWLILSFVRACVEGWKL